MRAAIYIDGLTVRFDASGNLAVEGALIRVKLNDVGRPPAAHAYAGQPGYILSNSSGRALAWCSVEAYEAAQDPEPSCRQSAGMIEQARYLRKLAEWKARRMARGS